MSTTSLLMDTEICLDGPANENCTMIFAHGAGAAMHSPFMEFFATGLAREGFRVARFEFPYMAKQRQAGRKLPPDNDAVLSQAWLDVIDSLRTDRVVLVGKSMGGRIASIVADEANVDGVVCLGYPFHPTSRPYLLRLSHLENMATPTLILQGTRDGFGSRERVTEFDLSPEVQLHWLEDGDHGFKPRRCSGRTQQDNWHEAISVMTGFADLLCN